jgi:hypothetical protein
MTLNEQSGTPLVVQITVFVPFGNTVPLGGLHNTGGQLPLGTGPVYVTIVPHMPGVVFVMMSPVQVNEQGPEPGSTVTVKSQLLVLPNPSVTVQLTGVVPIGKSEPLAGMHPTLPPPQLTTVASVG